MRLSTVLLTLMLAQLISAQECDPKFHFGFTSKGYYVDHQIIYSDCPKKKAIMIYETNQKDTNQVNTENLENWSDKGKLIIDNSTVKDYLFLACNQSASVRDKGYLLGYELDKCLRLTDCKSWSPLTNPLKGTAPLNWITPTYDNQLGKWVSMGDRKKRKLIMSSDLNNWDEHTPGFELPNESYRNYIQEIFTITMKNTKKVYWVVYIRQWIEKTTVYYIGQFDQNKVLKFEDPVQRFDYGRDFNELAVVEGCKSYGGSSRIGIGTIKSQAYENMKFSIQTFMAWPRKLTLGKSSSGQLQLRFEPLAFARKSETISPKSVVTVNDDLLRKANNNFRLYANISFTQDTKELGFNMGDAATFGFIPPGSDVFLRVKEAKSTLYFSAPLKTVSNIIEMTIMVDGCILEFFANNAVTITVLVWPQPTCGSSPCEIKVYNTGGQIDIQDITLWSY